jgi:hypothetical protein
LVMTVAPCNRVVEILKLMDQAIGMCGPPSR